MRAFFRSNQLYSLGLLHFVDGGDTIVVQSAETKTGVDLCP